MIEIIEDTARFRDLKDEWSGLLDDSGSDCLFLTWEWLYTWWTHLSQGRRLFILAVRSGRDLIAIAPLAVRPPEPERLVPFRLLEFLGTGIVGSDYLDLIVRRENESETLQALAEFFGNGKMVLELGQLRRGSSLAANFAGRLREQGWGISEVKSGVCPFIRLTGLSWESYLTALGAAHRYNFKRRLKNLMRDFDARLERIRSEAERREALAALVSLHNMRWGTRGHAGAFSTPGLLSFHEEMTRIALERGWLRLFVLWLEGKPAASIYGFRYGRKFYFYQSGFDPGYAKQSVGLVIMGLAIQSAIEEEVEEYDLLHGDEPYKFQWARDVRDLGRLELYPPSVRGLFYRRVMEWSRLSTRTARRLLGDRLADRIVGG